MDFVSAQRRTLPGHGSLKPAALIEKERAGGSKNMIKRWFVDINE